MKRLIALLFCLIPVLAMGQTSYRGSGTGTATDTTSLSTRIDAKQDKASFADSARANGIGVATLAKGQPVYAGSADSLYSAYTVVPIFAFGFGSGAAGDTSAVTTSALYGAFFNKTDTLIVTSIKGVLGHGIGTDTLGVQVYFSDTLNAVAPTALLAATHPVNSTTVGNEQTTITNSAILPGNWVYCKSPTVVAGRKPTFGSFVISGYFRKPR